MNPEIEKELQKCVLQLKANGVAIIPAETGWSVVTDFKNTSTIEWLVASDSYIFPVVLLKESGQLIKYFNQVPDPVYDLIEFSERPLQLVGENVLNNPLQEITNLSSLGFRIPKDEFTNQLLFKYGRPLFAVTDSENSRNLSEKSILTENCYVVNLRQNMKRNIESLVVIKFYSNGQIEFLKR